MRDLIKIVSARLSQLMPIAGQGRFGVGLDIGNFSVKAVKTERNNGYKISGAAIEEIKNNDLKEAVKAALKNAGIEDKKVNLGISGKQTVIRCIDVPDMAEADFKNSLKYEAPKYIPFPVNEVVLDSVVLRHNIEPGKMLVLIAAAKKDFIEQRIKVIFDLGLEIGILDIDALALVNIFNLSNHQIKSATAQLGQAPPQSPPQGSAGKLGGQARQTEAGLAGEIIALLNIGSHLSTLVFLENGIFRFSRDIIFGGSQLTQKIAAKLNIDISEAEKLKLSTEIPEDARAVIDSGFVDLANELRLSFDYYESQTGKAATRVYLSGGGSVLEDMDKFMSSALNIAFEPWNPFSGLKPKENSDKMTVGKSAAHFAVAAGLSLR